MFDFENSKYQLNRLSMLSKAQTHFGDHNSITDRIHSDINLHLIPKNLRKMPKMHVNFEEFPALTKSQPISFDSFSSHHARNPSEFSSMVMNGSQISQLTRKKKVKKKRSHLDKYSNFIDTLSAASLYEPGVLWPQNKKDGQHSVEVLFQTADDEGFGDDGIDEAPAPRSQLGKTPRQEQTTGDAFLPLSSTCTHHQVEGNAEEPSGQLNDDENVLASSLDWTSRQQMSAELRDADGNGRDTGYGSPALQVLAMTAGETSQSVPVAIATVPSNHRASRREGGGYEGDTEQEEEVNEEANDLLHLISSSLDRFNASLHPTAGRFVPPACANRPCSDDLECSPEEMVVLVDVGQQQHTSADGQMRPSTSANWWCSRRFGLPASYPDQCGANFPTTLFQNDLLSTTGLSQHPSRLNDEKFCPPGWFDSKNGVGSNPSRTLVGDSGVTFTEVNADAALCSSNCCGCSALVRRTGDPRLARSLRLLNVFDDVPPRLASDHEENAQKSNNQTEVHDHNYACPHHDPCSRHADPSTTRQQSANTTWPNASIPPSGDEDQVASSGVQQPHSLPVRISRQGDENASRAQAASSSPLLSMLLEQASTGAGSGQSVLSRLLEDLVLTDGSGQSIISPWDHLGHCMSGVRTASGEEVVTAGPSSSLINSGNHGNPVASSPPSSSLLAPAMPFDFDSDVPATRSGGIIEKLGLAVKGQKGGADPMKAKPDVIRGPFCLPTGTPQTVESQAGLGAGLPGSSRHPFGSSGPISMTARPLFPACSTSGDSARSNGHVCSFQLLGASCDSSLVDLDWASRKLSTQSSESACPEPLPGTCNSLFLRHPAVTSRIRRASVTGRRSTGKSSSSSPLMGVEPGTGSGKPQVAKWKRACSFYLRGHCKKEDCEFAHDLTKVTCKFWEMSECFKGSTCPFLHGYPSEPCSNPTLE